MNDNRLLRNRVISPVSSVWVLVIVWVVALPCFGQPPKSKKPTSTPEFAVFADSPVDSIVGRIRMDLKELPPSTSMSETPASTPKLGSGKPPKASISPIGTIKTFKSARVKAVETNAQKCFVADEAVVLYRIFLANPDTTDGDREEALPRLEAWEQAAVDELTRVGPKWIPRKEAEVLQKDADKLVAEALEMLNVYNIAAANSKLELAQKNCPEHLESAFLLALGAYANRDYKVAEARFVQCLTRAPTHVPLLNNVAMCEMQLKRFEKGVKYWERAALIDLESEIVAQNLGQFVSDASTKKIGGVDKRVLSDATEAYQKMVSRNSRNRSDPTRGYVLAEKFRTESGGSQTPIEEFRIVGNGTGFVVADGYVLTVVGLVDDVEAIAIQNPLKPDGIPLAAKVSAIAKELDLALIACPDLKAPPVVIDTVPVRSGSEFLTLGCPTANALGTALKATRGTITGLPTTDTDGLLVLDTPTSPGSAGAPLCDKSGRVVGIITAKAYTAGFSQSNGMAIPTTDVVPFLKQQFRNDFPPKKPAEGSDPEARVSQSTVMVIIQKKR